MGNFHRIPPEQACALLDDPATQVVDIRDVESYRQSRIPGAVHLDNNSVAGFIAGTDSDRPLLVYCYHGHSSQSAAQFLCDQGFAQVYSLDGGFEYWRGQFTVDNQPTE